MTKMQASLLDNYNRATATDLWQVYGKHSRAKEQAMSYCRGKQYEMGGHDGRICSANTFQFSYAFQYENVEGNKCLCYITKAQDRCFRIDE